MFEIETFLKKQYFKKKTPRCFFSLISVKIDSRFWIKLVNAKVNQLRIKVNFEARVFILVEPKISFEKTCFIFLEEL